VNQLGFPLLSIVLWLIGYVTFKRSEPLFADLI
jgi:hypothetical protein